MEHIILGPIGFAPLLAAPVIGLLWTAFWIWMLIDAILREEHEYPGQESSQRLVWVVLIALIHPAAVFYLFMVFAKVKRGNMDVSPSIERGGP